MPARVVVSLLFWGLAQSLAGTAFGAEAWPPLAHVGPWPVLSQPVAFDGKIWMVNSVKGRNHNSADVYSYDPDEPEPRYERHLFSQDAGAPLVSGGMLFWPFEDSRFSLGWGHYLVTDGLHWRMGTIPTARIFHIHAMAESDGHIYAASSAWRAGLQVSRDGGTTWREVYDHPTAKGRVSRFVDLAAMDGAIFAHLVEGGRSSLVRVEPDGATEVPGWPQGRRILSLVSHGGAILGVVQDPDGNGLWRSDARASVRLAAPDGARGLASDGQTLWLLSAAAVWSNAEGPTWRHRADLSGGTPWQIALLAGQPYVTGAGDDGRGVLWGPKSDAVRATATRLAPVTGAPWAEARSAPPAGSDLAARLDRALAAPASYESHAPILRDLVYAAAQAPGAAQVLQSRLAYRAPELSLSLIGGNVQVPAGDLGRWVLLWGMSIAQRGRVPLELIAAPWRAPDNPSEKYFDAPPAALWAVAGTGQRDRATIDALVERLERAGDPLWLRGDVIGALSALTAKSFGYDLGAWRDWWRAAKESWPD